MIRSRFKAIRPSSYVLVLLFAGLLALYFLLPDVDAQGTVTYKKAPAGYEYSLVPSPATTATASTSAPASPTSSSPASPTPTRVATTTSTPTSSTSVLPTVVPTPSATS